MPDLILETRGLTKEFRGFTAVHGVDLTVRRGTIHALIGPNGAGKTTVFNLLTKFLDPSAGQITYNGRDITADAAGRCRAARAGALVPDLGGVSASERARECAGRVAAAARHLVSFLALDQIARRASTGAPTSCSQRSGSAGFEDSEAVALPYGRKRALEIATTLALDPEMLLLDEPMSGLGNEDIARISALIRHAARNRTVLMVEHNLSVVADLSDTITVLTRGRILAEGDYAAVSGNHEVVEAYLGTGHA